MREIGWRFFFFETTKMLLMTNSIMGTSRKIGWRYKSKITSLSNNLIKLSIRRWSTIMHPHGEPNYPGTKKGKKRRRRGPERNYLPYFPQVSIVALYRKNILLGPPSQNESAKSWKCWKQISYEKIQNIDIHIRNEALCSNLIGGDEILALSGRRWYLYAFNDYEKTPWRWKFFYEWRALKDILTF